MIESVKKNANTIVFIIASIGLLYIITKYDWQTIKDNSGFLSPFILAFGVPIMNSKLKIQENKNQLKIEERDKIRDDEFKKQIDTILNTVMNMLNGIHITLGDYEKMIDEIKQLIISHIGKDDFLDKFSNAIRGRSNSILIATKRCDQNYKTVLSSWTELIILFGIIYYKDKNKYDDSEEFKEYLEQEINSKIDLFYSSCDLNVMGLRIHNNKEIRFSKLLQTSQIHNRTNYMISILSENGFEKPEQITSVFKKYIKDFFELYFTAVTTWELCEKRKLTDAA
jgi:hypothetical protein